MQGPWESSRLVKRWGEGNNVGKSLYAVSMESNRQGSLTGLVNLNNSGSLWGPGAGMESWGDYGMWIVA